MKIPQLAIVLTHPIQYYAPIFALLTKRGACNIKVFYTYSQRQYDFVDKDFGTNIQWDIPLLDGYDYQFIENTAAKPGLDHFGGIKCPELNTQIENWGATHLLIFGWNYQVHLKTMRYFKGKIPVLFRGDSTLLDYDIRNINDILKRNKSLNLINAIKSLAKYKIRKAFLTWVYKNIDTALYVGQNNKAYYLAHGLKEKQLIFAPHAIDNERFSDDNLKQYEQKAKRWREKLNINKTDRAIIFVGKFESKKNPLILLEAFNELKKINKNLHLILIGSGYLEKELKARVNYNNNIHFLPFQNQSIMPVVYRLGDILCLPSQGPGETWGLVVNEAMACNRIVVASDKVGSAADLLKNKKYIFKANNLGSLTNALKKAINSSASELNNIQPKEIIKDWNFKVICETLESIVITKW
ncbi:glycosyltransferase family 4 protein [Carboxylicivirga marina]|uniref:Glycosyltransferase family 4 protein n=1 Tax=Carboxylicivirga marina TaxID=2800988 RepID=A0ABS1HJ26_9BACT|nr:glycosyltransferase family 4 protein [Carboxylicivirga marina]MBK3517671.1 glycosyltransferase family 4 protein [Carboxylicivirga marina]